LISPVPTGVIAYADAPMRRPITRSVVVILGMLSVVVPAIGEQPVSQAQRNWWAFQPLTEPTPPTVVGDSWARSSIDRFVLAKLQEHGLKPAPAAERRVWLRRAKFALVGLPPTSQEIDAFVQDTRPDAYERVVDQWLSSPHFGEHWGRYWLDVVRYTDYLNPRGDDSPEEGDVELFEAFRYRDWVVNELNRDLPFNDFIVHQIAGDQLPAATKGEINTDGLIATTMLTIGVWDNGDADKEKIVSDIVDDQINVVGQAFLGLTLACARCHDHKFDPISTVDYYGLAGIFYSTRVLKSVGPVGLSTIAMRVPLVKQQYVEKRDAQVAQIKEIEQKLKDSAAAESAKTAASAGATAPNPAAATLSEEQRAQVEQELARLKQEMLPPTPTALAVQDGGTPEGLFPKNGDVPIHVGGRYDQPGDVVPRRLPVFFCGTEQAPIANGSGRLELAQWVASSRNPLTPRVIVNRVWLKLFNQGLVRTPNNFGLLGEQPTHPQLLDWLASRFVAQQWSLKQLIRAIMLSSAYQQSAFVKNRQTAASEATAIDPDNRWLSRFPSRRLAAEELRDSILAVTGRLDATLGGRATMDLNRPRRSLYIQTVRADRRNFSTLFDAADPAQCVGQRNVTTVAPQALFMLNNSFVSENAKHFAAKLLAEASTDEQARIERAYSVLFGRSATENEAAIGKQFLAAAAKRDQATAWSEYIHVLLCANEFCYVD
jgi:hypothetical protein